MSEPKKEPKEPNIPDIMEWLMAASPNELEFLESRLQGQLSALEEDYHARVHRLKKLLTFIKTLQPNSGQFSEPRASESYASKGFTRQQKAEIERLRDAGLSPQEIAHEMGVDVQRINKSLSHLGKPRSASILVALNGAARR